MDNRKPPQGQDLLDLLEREESLFPPAKIRHRDARYIRQDIGLDGVLQIEWREKRAEYGFIYKTSVSPISLKGTIDIANQIRLLGLPPLIVLPYMSEDALLDLEERQMSGIDLCGNGLLLAPDFRIWRSGKPNLYKESRPVRNPFKGDSSIFARCFLLQERFESLSELQEFARGRLFDSPNFSRTEGLALGTASKAVRALSDELVVKKEGNSIVLQDARRLLHLLRRGMESETIKPSVIGKTSLNAELIWNHLASMREDGMLLSVMTGVSSAGHYGVLSGVDQSQIYVTDLDFACDLLSVKAGRGFPNIHLFEEKKNVVYFDARAEGDSYWASPIQTWLELATAGPREQEAAKELERILLANKADLL